MQFGQGSAVDYAGPEDTAALDGDAIEEVRALSRIVHRQTLALVQLPLVPVIRLLRY